VFYLNIYNDMKEKKAEVWHRGTPPHILLC